MDRFGNRYAQPVIVDVESIVKVFSAGSKLKDILPTIINISAENHKYLQQWKNARWDISTVKGILILIEKYELNDLQLQGKALWTLYMILAYGGKESPELVEGMRNNNNLIHLFHETLLKLLLEFTVYNQVIDIFRLLVNEYGFSAAKIFEIGSTLVSKIPGLINDDCYIALIHFAGECSRIEPISVTTAMPFLASAFALIGSDSNASYFLYRSLDFLLMGLTIDQHESFQTIPDSIEEGNRSPSAQKTSSTKQEIKDKTITYTLNLLRSLATIQPNNAKFIFNNTELFTAILRIIQNNSIPSENTLVTSTSITRLSPQELILREAISSLNALIIDEETRQSLKIYFPVTKLINIVQLNYLSVNEVIMEFYLLLYEIDLPYIYEEQKYSPIGSYIDQQFFLKMFQSLIINIKELFPSPSTITTKVEEDEEEGEGNGERREENDEVEGSSGSDEIEEEGVVADETSRSKKKKKRKTKGSHGVVLITSSTKVIKCNFIYRILFKMETSLHLVSDITQYTTEKLQLFQSILPILQSKSPLEWNLYYLPSMIDIIVLLFKGCEYCWEIPKIDLLDAEFLHISNQLINQFGQEQLQQQQQPGKEAITEGKEKDGGADEPQNTTGSTKVAGGMLNNNRFFDSKDRNSLYYLVGCDDLSTIPSILRRSITNDSDRSVSIDQLNPTSPNAPQQPGSSPQTPTSTTGRKFLSLSRKNTFTKEEVNNLEASEGGNNKEDNDNKLELRRYYENALKLSTVSQYNECIQLIQSFKQYLLSNISIIETLIVNWELHTIDTNCQRLLFLYLLVHFFDLQDLLKKMYESNYIYDLLWRLIYQQQPNSSSSTSKLPINAVAIDRMGSSVNDRNKSVDNLYNIKPIYGMTRKCIQLLTIFVREKGSFEHSVHFAEFLHLLLTTRPERLRDITASQASSSMMSAADEVARDNNNNNSNENEMDRGASDDDLLLNTRDNVSLFANIAFRVSSVDLLAMIENPLNFRPSASGNNPDEFSSSNPVIIEDIVNMDLHYSAVSALLALSHFDRTVRRKMITYATNIIESLNFICPTDAINYKPMIYLVKSMIEFIAKLELVNEETIIGLILRCLKSPLLYIKSQICDLIYYIGIENPGFIYRGLSRNEVENELLFILTMTNPDNAILLLNTLKACCQIIHNINLKPVWIPVTWLSHWSKYPKNNTPLTVLIQGREFISVKTLLLILSLLDKCPKYYRLVYFTHILSFASSLMYACVEGVIPNTSPVTALASANTPPHSPLGHSILDADDENSSSLLPPPASPATPPSQYIRETLIQHILPLIPIAIDFIMTLGKKFNKQRKSITQIDNPIHARMAQVDNVPDDSGKSNSGTSSIIPPGMPESYSQMIANRFYHNNDKKFNLWLLLQDINNYEQQSTASSSQGSGDVKEGSEIKSVEIPLEVLQGIIEEKLSTNPQYFLQDHTTYYPSNLSNRALPPPPTASPKSPPSLNSSSRRKNNNNSSNSSSQNAVSTISDRLQAKKVSPAQLLAIFKSKPIETLTERTIDCIYSFICTDEMFPLSTYLQHIHLFQTNPIIASISYFMTEHRQNTIILKRGLECVKYYAENQMHLSLIAMHSPLALIYTVKHLKEVIDIQLSFTKIIFMVSQINDDFAKENLIRFNIHYLLIEMIHSQQYELSKIALQCILSLLTNDTNAVALTQNTGLISSVSALLDSSSSSTSSSSGMSSSSSMNKDIKIQYYGIKILIMIDDYLPELISQSTNKSSKHALFSIMKKSRKSLINYLKTNYHYYYQNNIFQKTLNLSKNDGNNDNSISATNGNGMIGGSAPASPTSGGSGKKGFASLNETIEKNDIEELLNHPIWQKEKCVIM